MAPDHIPREATGSELGKRTLASLAAVVGNIGELRTFDGRGYGKSAKSKGLQPQHARLVAGAASALVTFLGIHTKTAEPRASRRRPRLCEKAEELLEGRSPARFVQAVRLVSVRPAP